MPKLKTSKIDAMVGRRIRAEREHQELTLDTLAEQTGMTLQMLGRYERGASGLTISRLVLIARALGKRTTFFLK